MRRAFIRATAALAAIGLSAKAAAQQAPAPAPAPAPASKGGRVKVVYQLSEGIDQAVRAMANLRNHLNAAPDTKIVVVAFGYGVDFLVEGAKDSRGNTFEAAVGALGSSGVEFRVCRNTLTARKISEQSLLMDAKIVQAGVVEIARLQFDEGYAYLKP
jgi:intracellular sulfur oxidation DsrE/DsrF family protein